MTINSIFSQFPCPRNSGLTWLGGFDSRPQEPMKLQVRCTQGCKPPKPRPTQCSDWSTRNVVTGFLQSARWKPQSLCQSRKSHYPHILPPLGVSHQVRLALQDRKIRPKFKAGNTKEFADLFKNHHVLQCWQLVQTESTLWPTAAHDSNTPKGGITCPQRVPCPVPIFLWERSDGCVVWIYKSLFFLWGK